MPLSFRGRLTFPPLEETRRDSSPGRYEIAYVVLRSDSTLSFLAFRFGKDGS